MARRRSIQALGTLCLLSQTLGCSDPTAQGAFGEESEPIVNGEVSSVADDGVVSIGAKGHASCSGSLIAPNVVLTALHCVSEFDNSSGAVCNADGTITASSPEDGKFGATLDPTSLEIRVGVEYHASVDAHGLKVTGTGSTNICSNDLALVTLDTDLDAPIVPLRLGASIERGERVRVVGYGETTMDGSTGRFSRSNLLVLDVGADLTSSGSKTAAPRTFVVGEGPCHGDSGGPARSEETQAALGVSSIISGLACTAPGVRNTYTQIPPFETLIRKVLSDAGHEPLLESSGSDAGGAGNAGGAGDAGGAAGFAGSTDAGGSPPDGAGGSTTTGGSSAVGGGANGGDSVGGSSGTGGDGTSTGATPNASQGSGSRRDPSCACRTGPESPRRAPLGMLGGLLATLGFVLRRRRRA